jgi:exodeoxyribonuclease VII small subunit
MTQSPAPAPAQSLSFEAALAELEQIVRDMETGKATLEQSVTAYERGIELKNHCQAKLSDAQLRISQISQAADGSVTEKPWRDEGASQ